MKAEQTNSERLAVVPGSLVNYCTGVRPDTWAEATAAPPAQLCYQCDLMYFPEIVSDCQINAHLYLSGDAKT